MPHGFRGAHAVRYFGDIERVFEAVQHGINTAVEMMGGLAPGPSLRWLPYGASDGEPTGGGSVTAGAWDRSNIVVTRWDWDTAGSRILTLAEYNLDLFNGILNRFETMLATDFVLPKTSRAMGLVAESLRAVLPPFSEATGRFRQVVVRAAGRVLDDAGGRDEVEHNQVLADGYRLEMEAVCQSNVEEIRGFAHELRMQHGLLMHKAEEAWNVDALAFHFQALADAALAASRVAEQAADEFEDGVRAAGRDFDAASEAIGQADSSFQNEAENLVDELRHYINLTRNIVDSFCLKQGITSFTPFFDLKTTLATSDLTAMRAAFAASAHDHLLQLAKLADQYDDYRMYRGVEASVEAIELFWAKLDAATRQLLIDKFPMTIGNLNGIPFGYRAKANTINIDNHLADINAQIADLEAELAANPMFFGDTWVTTWPVDLIGAKVNLLADLRQTQLSLRNIRFGEAIPPNHPATRPTHVVAFDPERHSIITFHGTFGPDGHVSPNIRNIGIHVPGTGTRISNFYGVNTSARNMFKASNQMNSGSIDTGIFAFGGGVFPQNLIQATSSNWAQNMAPALLGFAAAAQRHRTGPEGVRLTVSGHSYGGTVIGFAQQLGMRPNAVLHIASKGVGNSIESVKGIHPNSNNTVYYSMMAETDFINFFQGVEFLHFGGGRSSLEYPFVRVATGFLYTRDSEGNLIRGDSIASLGLFGSHSTLFEPDSTSLHNIAAVITGGQGIANYEKYVGFANLCGAEILPTTPVSCVVPIFGEDYSSGNAPDYSLPRGSDRFSIPIRDSRAQSITGG